MICAIELGYCVWKEWRREGLLQTVRVGLTPKKGHAFFCAPSPPIFAFTKVDRKTPECTMPAAFRQDHDGCKAKQNKARQTFLHSTGVRMHEHTTNNAHQTHTKRQGKYSTLYHTTQHHTKTTMYTTNALRHTTQYRVHHTTPQYNTSYHPTLRAPSVVIGFSVSIVMASE